MDIQIYITAALLVYMVFVSIFLFKIYSFFRVLSKSVGEKDLISVLEEVVNRVSKNDAKLIRFGNDLSQIKNEQRQSVQRIGHVRYNPFNDMGGDHSFCLTLLNDRLDGVIITSLHSRDMTRIYLKPVKNGTSTLSLSKEEEKSLGLAINHPVQKHIVK